MQPAPIFDTGSSLFFDSTTINSLCVESKPFGKNFREQLKKTNYKKYQESIQLVYKHYNDIFDEVFAEAFEDEGHKDALHLIVGKQIQELPS